MYNLINDIYGLYINIYINYNLTGIPFSKAYIVYIYINMYIFMYCCHICIPLFQGFI